MRIIVIEDRVYKVTEKQYSILDNKKKELDNQEYYHGKDVELNDLIESMIESFKFIGFIDFDFRL